MVNPPPEWRPCASPFAGPRGLRDSEEARSAGCYRTAVEGGWLVVEVDAETHPRHAYIPDPQHVWTGDGAFRRERPAAHAPVNPSLEKWWSRCSATIGPLVSSMENIEGVPRHARVIWTQGRGSNIEAIANNQPLLFQLQLADGFRIAGGPTVTLQVMRVGAFRQLVLTTDSRVEFRDEDKIVFLARLDHYIAILETVEHDEAKTDIKCLQPDFDRFPPKDRAAAEAEINSAAPATSEAVEQSLQRFRDAWTRVSRVANSALAALEAGAAEDRSP